MQFNLLSNYLLYLLITVNHFKQMTQIICDKYKKILENKEKITK